jgi:hypothetical protein
MMQIRVTLQNQYSQIAAAVFWHQKMVSADYPVRAIFAYSGSADI